LCSRKLRCVFSCSILSLMYYSPVVRVTPHSQPPPPPLLSQTLTISEFLTISNNPPLSQNSLFLKPSAISEFSISQSSRYLKPPAISNLPLSQTSHCLKRHYLGHPLSQPPAVSLPPAAHPSPPLSQTSPLSQTPPAISNPHYPNPSAI